AFTKSGPQYLFGGYPLWHTSKSIAILGLSSWKKSCEQRATSRASTLDRRRHFSGGTPPRATACCPDYFARPPCHSTIFTTKRIFTTSSGLALGRCLTRPSLPGTSSS